MKTLTIIPSVRAVPEGDAIYMDIKATDGLRLYAKHWPGRVVCLYRKGARNEIAYGKAYDPSTLPFDVRFMGESFSEVKELLDSSTVILAAGDNHLDLDLPKFTRTPIVYIIENTLKTRLDILKLENTSIVQRIKSSLWTLLTEQKRKKAFRVAAGIQANGVPAFDAYRSLTDNMLLYFDNRVSETQMITESELQEKVDYLKQNRPLRLAFSGRLEKLKGADHLIPVAKALANLGVPFEFHVFGGGSLKDSMQKQAKDSEIAGQIIFHGPVSFDDVLIPTLKSSIDLFVCCHRQSDPSCTYLETLACGVPIVGYANEALSGLLRFGNFGAASKMDDILRIAKKIQFFDDNRIELTKLLNEIMKFSKLHGFENEFKKRTTQIETMAHIH